MPADHQHGYYSTKIGVQPRPHMLLRLLRHYRPLHVSGICIYSLWNRPVDSKPSNGWFTLTIKIWIQVLNISSIYPSSNCLLQSGSQKSSSNNLPPMKLVVYSATFRSESIKMSILPDDIIDGCPSDLPSLHPPIKRGLSFPPSISPTWFPAAYLL